MKKNLFVIGDLVIDHTVFVTIPPGTIQDVSGETVYNVVRRQDGAGGAANSARILGVLNEGQTYLWGVIGSSTWGGFRTILESSQLLDNARSNIEFRGVQDETDAKMNTITRLILVEENGRIKRTIRFNDVEHVHVSDSKRETIMYHLKHVHDRNPLDAIVINDLDKKCLTKDIVTAIAGFAEDNRIPLFVDPKRDRSKYTDIKGTAILPNLLEWCYLIEQPEEKRYKYWRNNLDSSEVLTEMANLSFRYLGNFKYHIITCDRLGAVVIAPHPKREHLYAVYRAGAAPSSEQVIDSPIGCGDIMTAIFAATYDKSWEETEGSTEMALAAFHQANIAVGCYCDMSWHRMPSYELIRERQKTNPQYSYRLLAEPSKGMLYLPQKEHIILSEVETVLPRIYSVSVNFKSKIKALLEKITILAQQITPQSLRLGAPSGAGKSRIIEGLLNTLPQRGMPAIEITKKTLVGLVDKKNRAMQELSELMKQSGYELGGGPIPCFVIVDEAYGNYFSQKSMLDLLHWAHAEGIRFVFVDSLFHSSNKKKVKILDDISSRCFLFEFPGIAERPGDIPYLIANKLLERAESGGLRTIKIDGKLLLSVTNRILEDKHPRETLYALSSVFDNAKKDNQSGHSILVQFEHLPENLAALSRSSGRFSPSVFIVSRS
ncbi:MAG: hypothetical protein V7641_4899 [Blastocatellia bacterium]